MLDWLGKLDPNTVISLVVLVGSLGAWAVKKIRGEQTDSLDDLLRGFGKQVIHVLLTDPQVTAAISPDALKKLASEQLWKLASLAKVPRNATTNALADNLVEHIVGDTLHELRAKAFDEFIANMRSEREAIAK